ncbi:beta-1,6-N-acetylglucosaminyltransferase [Propioniciclava soli]|uniref:Beta-1,6-N-acetylglucosaminyltransferase n=1 Tax=Propioniciclava soli TaxID=2775081 RepID=A0ABZ3C6J5_9ACTN
MGEAAFCYVVMAHNPDGVDRLVRRIRSLSPSANVLVRFEPHQGFDAEALRVAGAHPLASAIHVRWGSWELTAAMIEALATAEAEFHAEHYVLVSGTDYPIRSLAAWEREWVDQGADALVEQTPDQPDNWRFRWFLPEVRFPSQPSLYRAVRHVGWRIGTLTRPVLQVLPRFVEGDRRWFVGVRRPGVRPPVPIVKASQWMTLSARALRRVLDRDARESQLRRWFRTVRITDEIYLQSLVHDDPELRVVQGPTTLKEFGENPSSPLWLDADRLRRLTDGARAPFARKFAPDAPAELFAAADALADAERS